MDPNQSEAYQQARRKVRAMKGFYIHAFFFILIHSALFVVNFLATPKYLWAVFPLLGWGIGLCAHGFTVFGILGLWEPEWEERQIKRLLEKK
jgi:hypothetical protein